MKDGVVWRVLTPEFLYSFRTAMFNEQEFRDRLNELRDRNNQLI